MPFDSETVLPEHWVRAGSEAIRIGQALSSQDTGFFVDSSIMEDIFRSCDLNYRLKEAIEWGNGYELPLNVYHRDLGCLAQAGTLCQMVLNLRRKTSQNRLNKDRVLRCVSKSDPDFEKVIGLAVHGIEVHREDSFVPNSSILNGTPPLRKAYKEAHSAVNKMLYDLWKAELVFILPKSALMELGGVHFSCQHWATKKGKKCGRPIHDASDRKYGAINSPKVSLMSELYYGPVVLPTIVDIVLMILQFIDDMIRKMGADFDIRDVILFKNDLSKAFMLLNFRAEDVELLAAELTGELCVVYHTGLFGLGTLPYAFAVISRVLERNLNSAPPGFSQMFGRLKVYVDDLMSVTMRQHLERDNELVVGYCNALLGPNAVESDKFESGRIIVVIGWTIDLNDMLLTLSSDNFRNTAFAFFNVDLHHKVQVRELMKLASLGSRYSLIIREMRVVNSAIYRNYVGMHDPNKFVEWHEEAKVAVWMWRAVLLMLKLDEKTYAKPLESFRSLAPTIVICFDSSLKGVGVILRKYMGVNDLGLFQEGEVIAVGSFQYKDLPEPIDLCDDSSNQNLSEFIGVVYGLLMIRSLGFTHMGIALKGDSVTALRWSEKERFRGALSKPAALVYLSVCMEFGFEVVLTEHVSSEENDLCDRLSRGTLPKVLCLEGLCDLGLIHSMSKSTESLVSLCDYRYTFTTVGDLLDFWEKVRRNY